MVNRTLAEKFCNLLAVLNRATEEFENTASAIADKNMKRTVTSIAVESSQYANELTSQLQVLGMENFVVSKVNCDELRRSIGTVATASNKESIIDAWNRSEHFLVKAYREVLNEYFPFETLRRMIAYQLNNLRCEFMKMRLLSEVSAYQATDNRQAVLI